MFKGDNLSVPNTHTCSPFGIQIMEVILPGWSLSPNSFSPVLAISLLLALSGLFPRCLGNEESIKALKEANTGVCKAHQLGPELEFQLRRIGYYGCKMIQDVVEYVKKSETCLYHANLIYQPLEPLHPTMVSWPFEAWGLYMVGPITPKSSTAHSYILAATDYSSKWVEAIPSRETKKDNVIDFIRTHIIYQYGSSLNYDG
ncbi:uncharacterized protein E5676_scaffold464G00480 [Cucumis melo var. makuwa]|uniref:Integrase catalytic domain-containing protein n=1 Tax=Cucumis melo var. makuwa TaxID=1194695 RepID=A0A5D3BCD1_CUCMM|nr:uncharacterized protein E5676_scaffold464G00480 [Cucumis melo var. makuwa]